MVIQSSSQIEIQWSAPEDNGGCLVTSYAVYRDEGMKIIQSGEWISLDGITQQMLAGDLTPISTEVNLVEDPAVRNKATLNSLIVT